MIPAYIALRKLILKGNKGLKCEVYSVKCIMYSVYYIGYSVKCIAYSVKCTVNCVHFIITSLLRRLRARTLPNATPPIGKIYSIIKMVVTFEPLILEGLKNYDIIYFVTGRAIYNRLGVAAP